jgi:hypothetical protein
VQEQRSNATGLDISAVGALWKAGMMKEAEGICDPDFPEEQRLFNLTGFLE